MISKEVFKNIHRIQIITSRMVRDIFAGHYKSVFKGQGMEFDEVRQYEPGDAIRSIDWNVTARMGEPFVKKFVEERELTIMLLVDVSRSIYFGTEQWFKKELAAEICSLLALSAIKNNDKIGLIVFSDCIEKFVPPHKGLRYVLRIIREVLYANPCGRGTNIPLALEYLNRVCKRPTIVFLISDFYTTNFKMSLSITSKKHDVIALSINDPREVELPSMGIVEFYDAETRDRVVIDTSNPITRNEFCKYSQVLRKQRQDIFNSVKVDYVELMLSNPYVKELVKFFKMRERKIK